MKWLVWIIFAVFGFYLLGNNFDAKLGMIDDHEIAMFLGVDGRVSPSEIPSEIMKTEVGQWGSYLRYRPSYYTLRVLETSLWRDDARTWYIARYIMLVVSMVIAFKIMTMYFPPVVSYMFIFYIMTMPFWPDMLTRLGPSEMYALPSVLFFVYGILQNKLWLVTLGYTLAIGSKENLLILFPILLIWVISKAIKKTLSKKELIASSLMIAFTVVVVGAIVVATIRAGADIYGTEISYRYRITKFVWDIPKIVMDRHMLPSLIVLLLAIASYIARKSLTVGKHIALMLIILAVIASQYIFYINLLPSNMRYDFPALLLFPVLDLVAIHTIWAMLARHKYLPYIKLASYLAIIAISTVYIFHRGYALTHIQSLKNVAGSVNFDQQLQIIVSKIQDEPEASLVYVSARYIDFEPVISLSRYLTANRLANPMILSYTREKNLSDPKGLELEDRFVASMDGVAIPDRSFARFSPLSSLSTPCYSITFGAALPLPLCPEIAHF